MANLDETKTRLINQATILSVQENPDSTYLIGFLGQPGDSTAPFIAVKLADILGAGSSPRSMMPAMMALSETQQDGQPASEEVRVSVQEFFDSLHDTKVAHFSFAIFPAKDADAFSAALVYDSQHYFPENTSAIVELRSAGRKKYYAINTGLTASECETGTIQVSANSPVPVQVSFYVDDDMNIWIIGDSQEATYSLSVQMPLVPKSE